MIPFQIPLKNGFTWSHTPLMAVQAEENACLMFSQMLMTAFRNPSLVCLSVTSAVTSPATAAMTMPTGFAFCAAFSSYCATVAPSVATL